MKINSPRVLALIIAALFSAIFSAGLIILCRVEGISFSPYFILVTLVVFVASFYLTQFFLYQFIIEKINIIYKSIHKTATGKTEKNFRFSDDILKTVNEEVSDWADEKSKEIERLTQMEVYRKEFIGNISHELKTPIFIIQGYILTLLDGGLDDPSINRKYLEKSEQSINRMITIVKDLETISGLEHGQLILKTENFEITSLIREVFETLEENASKKNIELQLKDGTPKTTLCNGDKEKIRQVITNLILNAVNYGNESGFVRLSIYDIDENWMVEVKDNGIGIEEKHIPRLFERFYRVDKSRSTQTGGTGLGLAIVKHIIEAHKQRINIRSTPGEGTIVNFTIKKAENR